MSLVERLTDDMKTAMKSKDKFALTVIRMIRSELKYAEIDKGTPLNDDESFQILNKEMKKRRESVEDYTKADRPEEVEKLKREIEIIQSYLPEQLTEEEIEGIIDNTIAETGVSSKKEMGKLMSAVMPKLQGRADGKLVSQIVSNKLN
ncbi:GatB/YqeY domain-containing protein [Proteinivorax hydrogeniformans]|uniref:GatB/YqeY domain-containing protein n=1 Tax=Proteinivorax hydrogeniformans TaxID=1826727 RepID=A0AAU8HWQ4_9FIRM